MSDDDLAEPRVERPRRGARLSVAWLLPLIALAIAGGAAWRHYAALGPQITIVLDNAAGLEAGRTAIKYRDVEIGRIESLAFDDDFARVRARARMDGAVRDRLREGALFWVVRPQLTASGVSGLDTLLSGSYLAVDWGAGDGAQADTFAAAPEPPLTPSDTPGRRITLRAQDGGALAPGAPVYFKSIEVGRVETKRLSDDGRMIEFDVFVNAPYSDRIDARTRFWNASGVSVALGAQGLRLDVTSLAALLRGGVVFDRFADAAAGPEDTAAFILHATREEAADSRFSENPAAQLRLSVAFDQSVRGLGDGAPVEYRGVQIGVVEAIAFVPGAALNTLQIVATLLIQPERIGVIDTIPESNLAFFQRSVERGLRARLASGSLVTGALYVELVDAPDAPPERLDLDAKPYPRLPSVPSTLDALRGRAEEVLARINKLPVEELLASAIAALDSVAALAADPDLKRAPQELTGALSAARGMLDGLAEADLAGDAARAMAATSSAAAAFENAAAGLPALVRRLNDAAAKAESAIDAYGAGSSLNTEAVAALREMRQAARAISTLAQTLERRPNSLIIGR